MSAILEFVDVHYTYPGQSTAALRGVDVQLPQGSKIVLVGQNGSGKSTLLLHGNGILRPDRGSVHFGGRAVQYDARSLRALRREVGIVFQRPDDQLFSASVLQDISFGLLNLGVSEAETRRQVHATAEVCGVEHLLDRPTHALSVGEKARVALAGVLVMQPRLLLMDELTASLDPCMRRQVFTIFERLPAQQTTIVLATHDTDLVRRWAEQVVVMDAGRVVMVATPDDVFTDRAMTALLCLDGLC